MGVPSGLAWDLESSKAWDTGDTDPTKCIQPTSVPGHTCWAGELGLGPEGSMFRWGLLGQLAGAGREDETARLVGQGLRRLTHL